MLICKSKKFVNLHVINSYGISSMNLRLHLAWEMGKVINVIVLVTGVLLAWKQMSKHHQVTEKPAAEYDYIIGGYG